MVILKAASIAKPAILRKENNVLEHIGIHGALGGNAQLKYRQDKGACTGDPHIQERPSECQWADQGGQEEGEHASKEDRVERRSFEKSIELRGRFLCADLVVDDGAVNDMHLVQSTKSKATTTFNKVGFGRLGLLVTERADDDARQVDKLRLDFQDARSSDQLRLDSVRWCTERHESASELQKKVFSVDHC